jgi:hypothetical protein
MASSRHPLHTDLGCFRAVVVVGHLFKPFMIQGFLGSDPLVRIVHEYLLEKISKVLHEVVRLRDDVLETVSR